MNLMKSCQMYSPNWHLRFYNAHFHNTDMHQFTKFIWLLKLFYTKRTELFWDRVSPTNDGSVIPSTLVLLKDSRARRWPPWYTIFGTIILKLWLHVTNFIAVQCDPVSKFINSYMSSLAAMKVMLDYVTRHREKCVLSWYWEPRLECLQFY